MLIDGDWVAASDGAVFESTSPITGKPWARIPEATGADVDRAVRVADRAFTSGPWAT
ncbi:MAG: aldehyde dehydrogenase family protein, partial [Tabrizicola sp.]|nr:aldehyde dehydrogenase family protein [Tabrizicola sp.]